MLLLANYEVHTGNYWDHSFEKLRSDYSTVWTELNCQSELYCMAIIKEQRTKPSLNSKLNIFVSSLNAAAGREFFSNSSKFFPSPPSHLK